MFSHALVREALYEELGVTQRVRLHRRIAEAIEEICGDDREAHLGELAHHFLQAQELDRAIDYSARAGDRAVSLIAYEEGADLYASALQALELKTPTPGRRHIELMLALGNAQTRAAEAHQAKGNFRRAALLARELEDHELFADAVEGWSGWPEVGIIDHEAIELLEEALSLLGEGDSSMRARLLARLAIAVYFVSAARREELAKEAVAMARRVGDPATLAFALNDAHFVLQSPNSGVDKIALATELIEVAEKAGDHELAIEGRGMLLMDLLSAGEIEAVDREMPIYNREAATLRQPNYKRYALIRLAMKELLGGRFENVETLLAKFSPETARHGLEPNTLQAFGVVTFALRRDQGRRRGGGDLPELRRAVPSRARVAHRPGGALHGGRAPGGRAPGVRDARRERLRGDPDRRELGCRDGADGGGRLLPQGHPARRLAVRAAAPVRAHGVNIIVGGGWTCHGSTERFLGLLAHTMGRYETADRHFKAARRANASLGAHPLVAIGRYQHARLLIDREAPGDRERANDLLGQVLETAYDLGMQTLVDRALALRVRLQGIDTADVGSSIDAVASVVEEERPDLRGHTAPTARSRSCSATSRGPPS